MTTAGKMTGRLVAAARALAGISLEDFADAAGLPHESVALIERSGSAWVRGEAEAAGLSRACEHFGIVVLDEDESMGAGVRLKFTRQDVKQLHRLEGEGGIAGTDDNP